MKVFLGVIVAIIAVALVFRLTRKPDSEGKLSGKQNALIENMAGTTPAHTGTIEEVIQTSSYTYMRIKENKEDIWVATVKEDMTVGEKFSYGEALEMINFTSKELNRTFDKILFISDNPDQGGNMMGSMAAPTTMGKPKVEQKADVVIPQSAGGISIAELYKNRDSYANKKVHVKGKVVKVNNEVMDRNWVHIQDGTSDSGNFDLTVTTLEFAKIDDIVEFEGTIVLNKDFGAGYVYEIIMENATVRR